MEINEIKSGRISDFELLFTETFYSELRVCKYDTLGFDAYYNENNVIFFFIDGDTLFFNNIIVAVTDLSDDYISILNKYFSNHFTYKHIKQAVENNKILSITRLTTIFTTTVL